METIDFFSEETPWQIRKEILKYDMARCMSDSERAAALGLPKSCRIRENAKIISPEKLVIGENCWIGEGAILDASGGLEIGENSQIGLSVFLWSHDSHKVSQLGLDSRKHQDKIIRKKTVVGANCFIAGPSCIMPGVTIGNNCIISPMSVVYKNVPDGAIYKPYREMYDFFKKNIDINEEVARLKGELEELKKVVLKMTEGVTNINK